MDIDYMRKNLNVLVRDIHSYTDAEMARALVRLANVSCPDTVRQQLTNPADEPKINLTACFEPTFEEPPAFEQSPSFEESKADISVSKGEWGAMKEALKALVLHARFASDEDDFEQSDDLKCAIRKADEAIKGASND